MGFQDHQHPGTLAPAAALQRPASDPRLAAQGQGSGWAGFRPGGRALPAWLASASVPRRTAASARAPLSPWCGKVCEHVCLCTVLLHQRPPCALHPQRAIMDWTPSDRPDALPITIYDFLWDRYREVRHMGARRVRCRCCMGAGAHKHLPLPVGQMPRGASPSTPMPSTSTALKVLPSAYVPSTPTILTAVPSTSTTSWDRNCEMHHGCCVLLLLLLHVASACIGSVGAAVAACAKPACPGSMLRFAIQVFDANKVCAQLPWEQG